MKESLIATLRDRNTSMEAFREASHQLANLLAAEIALTHDQVLLLPILRAGMALLPSFMAVFKKARVSFIGIHRDKNAIPHLYYEKIPPLSSHDYTIILDPMVATGGSTLLTLEKIQEKGGNPAHCHVVGMIGAPEGVAAIKKFYPETKTTLAVLDKGLDAKKYIVPGLGDFGDRFFGC